jgi:hypothetical protein
LIQIREEKRDLQWENQVAINVLVKPVEIVSGRGYVQYLYSPRPNPCRAIFGLGFPNRPSQSRRSVLASRALNLNFEIETTDSADFTDFEEVIGDERANLFVAKASGH